MNHPLARGLNGTGAGACWCPSPADLIEAALRSQTLAPSCLAHQADQIAAAAEAERIAAIVQPARDLEAALDRVQQNHAADVAQAQAAVDAAERERRLDDLDPMSAHLARVVGAPMVSTTNTAVPLNATANIIAAALGMTAA